MANLDQPRCAKRFVAAVHALFLSQYPQSLQFEQFVLLYMAIDACYKLTCVLHKPQKRLNHADRIAWMCEQFGIECPSWADPANPDRSEVAGIRNNTLHEALYMDAPLGFAVHGISAKQQSPMLERNLPFEMQHLVSRLLVALIGGNNAVYIGSPVNDRQMIGLDL